MAPTATWIAGDRLRGVPVAGEVVGADLQVHLGGGARRLRHDRVGHDVQALDPVDDDLDVLAPGVEDLPVEQRVARVLARRGRRHVLGPQRRQDPDHHRAGPGLLGLRVGGVERGPHRLLEGGEAEVGELAGRDVDLDVEPAELGLELGVRDRLEHLGVAQRRLEVAVDQVELDLQPGHRPLEVEARLGQHPRQRVEPAAHLLPVALPVLARELRRVDLGSHAHILAHRGPRAAPAASRARPHLPAETENCAHVCAILFLANTPRLGSTLVNEDRADVRQPPVAERRASRPRAPRRRRRRPVRVVARQDRPRGGRAPGGGERLHRRPHRAPRAAGRDAVHRAEGPHAGDRPVGARLRAAPGRATARGVGLLVLHPDAGGGRVRPLLPRARHRPFGAAVAGRRHRGRGRLPRRQRRGRRARLLRPRAPSASPPAGTCWPTPPTSPAPSATRCASATCGPARTCRTRSPTSARAPAGPGRPTSSTPAATRPGARTWCCATGSTPTPPTTRSSSPSPTSASGSGVDSSRDDRWLVFGSESKLTSEHRLLAHRRPRGHAPGRGPAPPGRRVLRRAGRRPAARRAQRRRRGLRAGAGPARTPAATPSGSRSCPRSPACGCWASTRTPRTSS